MYLKSVEIQGFKTFVDRVKLEFGPGVTVIVGPNGSGKSNLADAVLWVLGEQSLRSLRGKRMEDIIFAGSETRRQVGMAEVTLRIENDDGSLPLDFLEVEVSRRFFRSGESEYYLNKASCRLKDIQELFLDSGSGRSGVAIIGQGRIEEIISMRPEERRAILEETAGIARYRLRKKEACQRLEVLEKDLQRIYDLLAELNSQLNEVELEAKRARRHRKLSGVLFKIELVIKVREMEELEQRCRRSRERLQSLEKEKEKLKLLEQELDSKILEFQAQRDKSEQEGRNYQLELQSLQEQLAKTQSDLQLVREKQTVLAREQQERQRVQEYLAQEKFDLEAAFASLATERDEIKQNKERLAEAITAGEAAREELASEVELLTAEAEKIKNDLFQVTHERATCHNELVRLEEQHMVVQRLLQQKNSQIEEYKREITLLAAKLAEGQEQQQLLAAELARLEKKKTSLEEAIPRQEEEVAGQEKRLAKMQERQRILEARLRVLHQSRAAYEGFAEGVKFVLMASRQGELACAGVMGVVVEKLTVPAQLTRAIDVALGGAAQQILVKTAAEAETVINYLKARRGGRVTILPLEWLEPRHWPAWANWVLKESGVLGIAADLVSCEPAVRPAVRYLLGNVLVVEEIARALALGARLRPPLRLVTLDGETVQPRGAVSGGVSRQNTGFLQRSLEIEQLENELAGLKGNIKKGRQRLEALKLVLTNSRRQQQQLTEATIVCRSELQVLAQQHNRRSEQLNELREKITLLEQELAQNDTSSRELELAKDQRQELLAALRQQEEELNKQLGSVGKRLAARSQILTQLQQELAVNLARQEAINKTEAQLYIREQDLVRQQENWQRQFNELQKRQQEGELLAKKLAETEAKLRGDEEWLQGACRQLKSGCERLETERIARDEQQQELQRQQAELKGKQEKLAARRQQEEINMTRQEASLAALQTEITNHFGAGWQEELPRKGGHLEKKAEHLREVFKQKLELLGEVDPGAIILWERLQARYEDLQRQKQDLEDGRAALEQVISEMEKLMARQLKTTYEKVQMEFNAIFQELFEGGEASLQLNGNDILNAGLEIYVRPPGKKSQYLSLLSGGEKALTAIAFVFALLKVKPSAFCIFDEVDTALDDANVERFNRLLRQFAKRSQFIVISHRQGTMAAADVLYGVTMVEQGVSQVVSVRLEQLPA